MDSRLNGIPCVYFAQVAAKGKEFVDSFILAHDTNQSVYFHHLTTHIPDQIRKVGWLGPFATQGVEHFHSERKSAYMELSNRTKTERGQTVFAHFVAREEMSWEFREEDAEAQEKVLVARRKKEGNRVAKEVAKLTREKDEKEEKECA